MKQADIDEVLAHLTRALQAAEPALDDGSLAGFQLIAEWAVPEGGDYWMVWMHQAPGEPICKLAGQISDDERASLRFWSKDGSNPNFKLDHDSPVRRVLPFPEGLKPYSPDDD